MDSDNRPLGVLQLSTSDQRGGAQQVAWNLFAAYRTRGHASWLAVGRKLSFDTDVIQIRPPASSGGWAWWRWCIYHRLSPWDGRISWIVYLRSVFCALARGRGVIARQFGIEDFYFPRSRFILTLPPMRPDIIHAHNLHGGYFDLRVLPWISRQVPLMLTLHDAWLLSGNCAHSFDCGRWRTGCGRCPDISIYPGLRRDATALNWRRKRGIYAHSRIYIATPCQWLLDRVGQSILAPAVIEGRVIPNGVDTSVFKPGDRHAARKTLGIPSDVPVLLFVAKGIRTNPFKDYTTLRGAMEALSETSATEIWFLALGEIGPDERFGNVLIRFVPPVYDPNSVALYYQAADLYLHAARAETFPNTILEALACGTPVIATAVGGIPEQLEEGITGMLVPLGDIRAMAQGIRVLLADPDRRTRMGAAAAGAAQRHFTLDAQVDRYLEWYHSICGTPS